MSEEITALHANGNRIGVFVREADGSERHVGWLDLSLLEQAHWQAVHDMLVAGMRQLNPGRMSNQGAAIYDAKVDARPVVAADMCDYRLPQDQPSMIGPGIPTPARPRLYRHQGLQDMVFDSFLHAENEAARYSMLDRLWVVIAVVASAAIGLAFLARMAVDVIW